MSGNGSGNFVFSSGNVLPTIVPTSTSGGENIGVLKSHQTGGKSMRKRMGQSMGQRMSKRMSKSMRKRNKSKKHKSHKNKTRRNR